MTEKKERIVCLFKKKKKKKEREKEKDGNERKEEKKGVGCDAMLAFYL